MKISALDTKYIKYLLIQWELKAQKASRKIAANSYAISRVSAAAYCALKPTLRETLKRSTSALHWLTRERHSVANTH
ncbi:hypothetical protein [Shewanella kaireitica]|uniref:hypothetical protein n=1 Tax=Shewanella kaireitica TaxID=212021 RepID=UPI00200E85C1|nr:hypothetical protein [Shewanella kaireitica]MCL1093105.1 hypothetical protein [Shewanella kaireitica]